MNINTDYATNATELNTNNLSSYQTGIEKKGLDFNAKSVIFENMTGLHVDENTPYVMSKESHVRFGYFGEFFRASCNSTGGHTALVEDTAKKYTDLRDEILEQYKDNEDEMYKELGELNLAFETALKNTCLMPAYPQKVNSEIRTSYNEADRIRNERELAEISQQYNTYNKNIKDIMDNFQNNMLRHMNTFYESFIENIQSNDFDTAFAESMALLQNGETKSFEEISYNDVLKIRDILTNEATKFDEDGRPTEYRYKTPEDAFRALIRDTNISYTVRKDVVDRFGFYIKAEE